MHTTNQPYDAATLITQTQTARLTHIMVLNSIDVSHTITLLIRAAQGQEPHQEDVLGLVDAALQHIYQLLFASIGREDLEIPTNFWQQPGIGQLCADVLRWRYGYELITWSEAATLLFDDVHSLSANALQMRIRRLIQAGELTPYIDPGPKNPVYRHRLLRGQVLALRQRLSSQPHPPPQE